METVQNGTVVLKTDRYINVNSEIDEEQKPEKTNGVFTWIDEEGSPTVAPTRAGLYQDTLTFTAEVIPAPKKGDLIYFDIWDETDTVEEDEVIELDENRFELDGDIGIADFCELLKIDEEEALLMSMLPYKIGKFNHFCLTAHNYCDIL